MAGVRQDSKGWKITYTDHDKNRRSLRPGKNSTEETAKIIAIHVDSLVASKVASGPIDRQTAIWLAEIGDTLRKKLERAGLVEPAENDNPFLRGPTVGGLQKKVRELENEIIRLKSELKNLEECTRVHITEISNENNNPKRTPTAQTVAQLARR